MYCKRVNRKSQNYFQKAIIAMVITMIVSTVPAIAAIDISNSLDLLYDDGNGNTMPYRLFIPTPFDSNKDYPVVLFMHGAGERGTDNYLQVSVHIGGLVDTTRSGDNAAYLIAPQVPTGSQWVNVPWSEGSYDDSTAPAESLSMRLGIEILEHVIATRKVDTSRVYVTGLSMGGFGTWDAIARYPEKFAAAVPMSGGGNVDAASIIKDIPLRVYHGDSDTIVPVSGSRDMVNAIIAVGGSPIYTELEGWGHIIWAPIYNDSSDILYPWLFSKINEAPCPAADVTGDCEVNYEDLVIFAQNWLGCMSLDCP